MSLWQESLKGLYAEQFKDGSLLTTTKNKVRFDSVLIVLLMGYWEWK